MITKIMAKWVSYIWLAKSYHYQCHLLFVLIQNLDFCTFFIFTETETLYIVVIKDKLFTTFYRSTYIWNGLSLVFARMNTSASLTLFLRNTIINNLQINRHMPKAMYLSKLNKKYHFFCNLWINLNGKLNRVLN